MTQGGHDMYGPGPVKYYEERPCTACGKSMGSVSPYRRRCLDCKRERDRITAQRRKSKPIARAIREEILARVTCAYCGRTTSPSKDRYGHDLAPEIDHVQSLERGGTSAVENLQLLCRRCNRTKGW